MPICEKCKVEFEYSHTCDVTEKRELPVNNIVSQQFWLENKKFNFWNSVDLFKSLDDAIIARNALKQKEPNIPLRIVRESKKIVG